MQHACMHTRAHTHACMHACTSHTVARLQAVCCLHSFPTPRVHAAPVFRLCTHCAPLVFSVTWQHSAHYPPCRHLEEGAQSNTSNTRLYIRIDACTGIGTILPAQHFSQTSRECRTREKVCANIAQKVRDAGRVQTPVCAPLEQ